MLNDTLANTLSNMLNAEKVGKKSCLAKPSSKLIIKILDIMKHHGYINSYEVLDDGRGGIISISLNGRINKCSAIKPRFSVQLDEYKKFEKRFLPAAELGILIVSTTKGIMTHHEAMEKKMGGKLIAFVY